MKQNVKNKTIKWGFKCRYCCASKTRHLSEKKEENAWENFGESIVLAQIKCLENTYCPILFDNYFNSLSIIVIIFDKCVYAVGTAQFLNVTFLFLPSACLTVASAFTSLVLAKVEVEPHQKIKLGQKRNISNSMS